MKNLREFIVSFGNRGLAPRLVRAAPVLRERRRRATMQVIKPGRRHDRPAGKGAFMNVPIRRVILAAAALTVGGVGAASAATTLQGKTVTLYAAVGVGGG